MLPYNSIQQITFHQHVTILVATHSLRVVGVYSSYKATTKLSEPGLRKKARGALKNPPFRIYLSLPNVNFPLEVVDERHGTQGPEIGGFVEAFVQCQKKLATASCRHSPCQTLLIQHVSYLQGSESN